MIRGPPRSTLDRSSAASDVYKRQPHTKYNELMNEFYSRIDYCEKNYRSLSGNGGAKSDRGKTYIKFGAPDSIDRYTNNDDKVVETWIFKKQNRTFLFIDKDGTGKFQLAEGK